MEDMMLGWSDLKKVLTLTDGSVECPVNGCRQTVPRQKKKFRAVAAFQCPVHGIYISPSTFEYEDEKDNMLWTKTDDLALLERIKVPGVKRESRMARDNSEDSVTWNIFRYLETHNLIANFIKLTAGEHVARNPSVIYWSFCQTSKKPWQPLLEAATTFGERIGRHSEPDIIVNDDGVLAFVENKWLSGNLTRPTHSNNPKCYVTGGDGWFGKVFNPAADFKTVAVDARLYELMRLWLLGSYISDRAGKRFLFVNVVRGQTETDIETRFGAHIRSEPQRQFKRVAWETVCTDLVQPRAGCADTDRLIRYLREKTIGYRRVNGGATAKLSRALSLPA
jgi:hypothetical protein